MSRGERILMPESVLSFQSLPAEYQRVIHPAQEQHDTSIKSLQELVGGWSGAFIDLVSVTSLTSGQVEHLILKLDRKRPMSTSDEVTRYQAARDNSPANFVQHRILEMVCDRAGLRSSERTSDCEKDWVISSKYSGPKDSKWVLAWPFLTQLDPCLTNILTR